jgi:hypothetical protein
VKPTNRVSESRDDADNRFLECAETGSADYVTIRRVLELLTPELRRPYLDVPVPGALLSPVRVAVGALEEAAGAFLPSGHPFGLPVVARRTAFLPGSCQYGFDGSRFGRAGCRFVPVFIG